MATIIQNLGTISSPDSNTTITDGNGNYILTLYGSNDLVKLGNGMDTVILYGNNDTIQLGNGDNIVQASGNNETISVGNGNDTLIVNGANESITAGNGNDNITIDGSISQVSTNIIMVGNGNDTITIQGVTYNNIITAGNGSDTISISGISHNNIIAVGNGGSARDILNITGTSYNDVIIMGNGNNLLNLSGQTNQDIITVGNGRNIINISAAGMIDVVLAGNGGNFINDAGIGNIVKSGSGNDTLVYNASDLLEDAGGGFNTLLVTSHLSRPMDLTTFLNPVKNIQLIDLTGSGLANLAGYGNTLNLNDFAVDHSAGQFNSATGTVETLIVLAGSMDTVSISSNFVNVTPQTEKPITVTENLLVGGSLVSTPITLTNYLVFKEGDDTIILNQVGQQTPPIAHNDSYTITEASGQHYPELYQTGNILSNDLAMGGGNLSVKALDGHILNGSPYTETLADGNSLTLNSNGTFIYSINNPINGADVFNYTMSDGLQNSNSASITFNVADTAPVAVSDSFNVAEASGQTYPLSYTTGNVLLNDVHGGGLGFSVNPENVTLADGNSLALNADGTFTYKVNSPINGADVFNYTMSDGLLNSNSASITFNVHDTAPVAVSDSFNVTEASGQTYPLSYTTGNVLLNDVHGGGLGFSVNPENVTLADGNSLALNADGTFTYKVNSPINGADVFNYTMNDGLLNSNSASITFNVADTAPVAVSDSFNVTEASGQTYPLSYTTGNVLLNDVHGGGLGFSVNPENVTLADGNSLALNADGTFTYKVNSPINGADVFNYTMNDGLLNSNSASITFNVADTHSIPFDDSIR